jgi:gag-polypeptide of LTR copia-type/GAG-pre-integrase domain
MANPPNPLPLSIRSTTPIQLSHLIHTKLDNENFLLWKSQIYHVLRGHGLIGFLDGSRSAPDPTVAGANGTSSPNPKHESWIQQDQLILAWLFSSISPSILSQIARCQSSAEAWRALNHLHSSQSMAKILDLKLQLQTMKKGGSTCAEFINKIQILADRLRSIGTDVPDSELVMYAAQGLGSDYENFVTAFSMRSSVPSMNEFSSLLLAHEARLLTSLRSSTTSVVHLTTQSDSGNSDNSAYYVTSNKAQYYGRGRGQGRGRHNYPKGRGRGHYNNASPDSDIQCQICARWGHGALNCYHWFDIRYTSSASTNSDTSSSNPSHQALMAEPTSNPDHTTSYYIDSGASTHVTNDLNAMNNAYSYSGPEVVHIGNGKGLQIAHKGSALLPTPFQTLKLQNVLHVPEMTKNLLSVSQLTSDNNVSVEFFSDSCFVKDKETQRILLHDILHKGIYKLQPLHNLQVFQAAQSSPDLWHYRLAHCSFSVQDKLQKAQLITSKPSSSFFCSDCHKAKAHKLPFQPSTSSATHPLQVVHSDLWGPAPILSKKGHRYYVQFTDEFSRFSWLYTCASKSDVTLIFAQFRQRVENLLDYKIKVFQCDGGSEFKPIMKQFPEIIFQISCPYTPEQNA